MTEPTWYILYDGETVDGSGPPDYYTRTTDKEVAKKHWKKCKSNPYSCGKVVAYTDTKQIRIITEYDWEVL